MNEDAPNPIDVHVGHRVRLRRKMRGKSQGALAETLGVSFQQIQKYEKGTNRISASKLYEICLALEVQVSFFYEGLSAEADRVAGLAEGQGAAYEADFLSMPESVNLNMAFKRIPSAAVRRQMVDLAKTLAEELDESET